MGDAARAWLPPLREGWRALATDEAGVAGGLALGNDGVPFLLANAVWCPRHDGVDEAVRWCADRGLPPAVVTGTHAPLERALDDAGLTRSHGFALDPEAGDAPHRDDADGPEGEVVAWDRARDAGRLLAARFGAPELELPLATVLAAGLQSASPLECRIGYDGPDPVATVVSAVDRGWWLALLEAGPVARMMRDAFAEARVHGRSPARLRERDASVEDAVLWRWGMPGTDAGAA